MTQSNAPGTITFATAGPNTRTTQVFINLGNNGALDSQGFAAFGKVTSGMDVIQNFYSGYADNTTNDQGNITNGGKAYLLKTYPKLDTITTATVTSPLPAAPVKDQRNDRRRARTRRRSLRRRSSSSTDLGGLKP